MRNSNCTFKQIVDGGLLSLVHPELGRLHQLVVGRVDHLPQLEFRVNDRGVAEGGVGAVGQTLDKLAELALQGVVILGVLVGFDEGLKINGNLSLQQRKLVNSSQPEFKGIQKFLGRKIFGH